MEYALDLGLELTYVRRAQQSFLGSRGLEGAKLYRSLKSTYENLVYALIGIEIIDRTDARILQESEILGPNVRTDAEFSLLLISARMAFEFQDEETRKAYLATPWGRKVRNPDYMRKLVEAGEFNEEVYHTLRDILQLD